MSRGRRRRGRGAAGSRLSVRGAAAGFVALSGCALTHSEERNSPAVDAATAVTGDSGSGDAAGGPSLALWDARAIELPIVDAGLPRAPDFSRDVLYDRLAAQRVLYSWTTAEQYEALRTDRVLLTRTERPGVGRANLRSVIEKMATDGDPLALVLGGAAFQKGRFAWTNAWSTLRGWPGESYGDKLIRIELAPEAWLAKLVGGVFSVRDMSNAEVPLANALATPERIAAVFFQNEQPSNGESTYCGTFAGCANGVYREYFVNNERMVLRWSLATAEMRAELERSVALIESYRDYVRMPPVYLGDECNFSGAALCSWQGTPTAGYAPEHQYYESCSITSEYYVPTVAALDELIAALEAALFTPDPLTVDR